MRAVRWVGRNLWVAFLALVVGLASPTLAQDRPMSRESLVGLGGVHVVIEPMDPAMEREGLAQSTLRTDVEVKLRSAGIRVLTRDELLTTPGLPILDLKVEAVRLSGELPVYAVVVQLELNQAVMLTRNSAVALVATTWRTLTVAAAGAKVLYRMRETVRDLVDQFINDYLAANPKR